MATSKIDRLVDNFKTSLSTLFAESATFQSYNVKRSLIVGEPTVMEAADMPCIAIDLVEISDETRGAGRALSTDSVLSLQVSILYSPYASDFKKTDLWGASWELYNHLKDDIPTLNNGLFSALPRFGPCLFTRSRKLIDGKVAFVNAGQFSISFTEGRRTNYSR